MPLTDQCHTNNRYSLIPRSLIFLTRGDSVLLIKGAPSKKLWANLFNGIGGHIEPGEDILSAARREIKEETSLTPDSLWLCGVITVDTGGQPGICIFIFRGECAAGIPISTTEGTSFWIPIDEFDNLQMVEDLYTILPIVLHLKKEDPPLSLLYSYDEDDHLVITFGE